MAISLQRILNRMDRFQTVYTIEEPFKVRDIDEALRLIKRKYAFPWTLKKSSIKVFKDIIEYPTPTDYKDLGYLDNSSSDYADRERFIYTSLQQFYEDADSRNKICEIREGENKVLGVRHSKNPTSLTLNSANSAGDWIVDGDADEIVISDTITKDGFNSARITIVSSSGSATIKNNINDGETSNIEDSAVTSNLTYSGDETPAGTKNSVNLIFTILHDPYYNYLDNLFVNGQKQTSGVDYVLANQTITFTVAPDSTDIIIAQYRYLV